MCIVKIKIERRKQCIRKMSGCACIVIKTKGGGGTIILVCVLYFHPRFISKNSSHSRTIKSENSCS